MDEKKLIEQMKRGSHQAMEEWIAYYYGSVYHFLYCKCQDDALAKDLCQEVFIAFIRDLPTYKFQEKSLNYLFRVASHRYYDVLRKRKRMAVLAFDESYDYHANEKTDDSLLKYCDDDYLEKLIGDLMPPYLQDIIILHYFHGWTLKEIAEAMDVPLSTMKSRHQRALKLLRQAIEEDYHE